MKTTTRVLVAGAGLLALSAFQNTACEITIARADDQVSAEAKIKELENKIADLEVTQQSSSSDCTIWNSRNCAAETRTRFAS